MRRHGFYVILISLFFLSGCTMGTLTRIYATPGSGVSLTRLDAAAKRSGICEHSKESLYLFEVAGKIMDSLSKDKPVAKTDEPVCLSFEIHEHIRFQDSEAIDIQEYLREEFGSGYEFGSISVKLEIGLFDWCLNLVTFGIANSQTIVITGDRYLPSVAGTR